MVSCSNDINASCLNGGQCISNHCICATSCFLGDRCESSYNAIDLPIFSAMLEDTFTARIVYIIISICLVMIGLFNNIAALMTFTRESIRITACGVYLIVFCSTSIVYMVCLQINVLTIAGYDTPSYRLWSCYASPYISLTMGFTGLWSSVGIAIERVLIECFDMNLYGTRRHAILVSIGFFILSAVSNFPAIFAREYAPDPSGNPICLYNYSADSVWKQVNTIFLYFDVIVPCSTHLICSACILTTIARRKILIHRDNSFNQRLHRVWLRQLYIHRDFLIPPLFLITCLLPNAIHGHLLVTCVPYTSLGQLRLHIAFIFLLYIPAVFIYVVYIYPNDSYRKEFRQTGLSRVLCCCFQRRYKYESQETRPRTLTTSSVDTQIIEESHL